MEFDKEYSKFFEEFGKSKKMVLSTCFENKVTSRMMSIVMFDKKFYFQTYKNFRKYKQISKNHNVSLCIDNIQIDGICEELGHPLKNSEFCSLYKENFISSYQKYSSLECEVLFRVNPLFIERWRYIHNNQYIEIFDIKNKKYMLEEYKL